MATFTMTTLRRRMHPCQELVLLFCLVLATAFSIVPVPKAGHVGATPIGSLFSRLLLQEDQESKSGDEMAGDEESVAVDVELYIVGGVRTLPGEFPFFSSMYYNNTPSRCGGSLIARKWILTAAHCAELFPKDQMDLLQWRVGDYCTNGAENCGAPVSLRHTRRVFIHPRWDPVNITWDYALMELDQIVFSNHEVRIDRGSEFQKLREGDLVKSMGMGFVNDQGVYAEHLQDVNNLFLPLDKCEADFGFGRTLDESVMCTSGENFGNCHGDWGSPAVVADESPTGWIQVGIISFGRFRCENHDEPDGLARVSTAFDWIVETVCPIYKPGERWTPNFCKNFVHGNDDSAGTKKEKNKGKEKKRKNKNKDSEDEEEEEGEEEVENSTGIDGFSPFVCRDKETFLVGDKVKRCKKINSDRNVKKFCSTRSTALRDCPVACRVNGC